MVPTLAPSMTASAGTRSTSPPAANAVTISPRGRAALEDRGYAQAGQKGLEPVAERVAQDAPELGAEGARDPGLDHVHAPNQEGNRTGEINKG